MITWFWSRVGTLGVTTYKIATLLRFHPANAYFDYQVYMDTFYLVCLYLMQVYWTVLLIQMIKHYNKTGQNVDLQQQIR